MLAEEKDFSELSGDLTKAQSVIFNVPEFVLILNSNRVEFERKKAALQAVLKNSISKQAHNFLLILIRDGHLNELALILDLAHKFDLEKSGSVEATAESAVALDSAQIKKLNDIIAKKIEKKIILNNIINKNLIGGLRVKVGDTVIDASLLGKIERLRSQMEKE